MPIITFWSDNEKTIGQTVSTSLTATYMSMEHNYKILLISADYNNSTMEECFGSLETNNDLVKNLISSKKINLDTGINGLLKIADSNRITPEIIHDYTKIIFKNRLEIIYSPSNYVIDNENKFFENMKNIILNASRYYDYVFVDLKKGLRIVQQLDILEMSDVIVANINQNFKDIQNFIQNKDMKRFSNKVHWNICKYDKNSKYNSKNIVRKLLRKQEITEINYNTLVMEAAQEGNLVELLFRFRTLKGTEQENYVFIENIKKLIELIQLKFQSSRML